MSSWLARTGGSRSAAVDRLAAWRRWIWPAAIVAAVVLGNLPAIIGIVQVDPLVTLSSLGSGAFGANHLLPGQWTVDLDVGATSQALGHLAALDWLHGHIPWWNPYEGIGSPLAGGMQSAAFFPPTLLLALQDGQIAFRLILEVAAGLSTYALVLRLGAARPYAGVAGVLFALNGTFSWYAHAEINPVALLPVCLLGVELCRDETITSWKCLLLPAGVALSIVAGFPEVAFVDGLFVVLWALTRVVQEPGGQRFRARLAGRLAAYMVLGVGLAAPLLVAFAGYLSNGSTPSHANDAFKSLPVASLITLGMPYLLGPISALSDQIPAATRSSMAFNAGGYLTSGAVALGFAGGLFSRRERGLRLLIAVWILVGLGRAYGVGVVEHLLSVVPGLGQTAFWRDVEPSVEFGVAVLAALGLEALFARGPAAAEVDDEDGAGGDRGRRARRRKLADLVDRRWYGPIGAGLAAITFAGFAGLGARPILEAEAPFGGGYMAVAAAWTALLLLVVALGGLVGRRRAGLAVVGGAVVLESVLFFGYPLLSASRGVTLDSAPVAYLADHLGNQRFYSLDPALGLYGGPIAPNYGSYFKLASANYLDLPVPKLYQLYARENLDPYANPTMLDGTDFGREVPSPASPQQEFLQHTKGFEAIGVKYVLAGPKDAPALAKAGKVVFSDKLVTIFELPHPAPFFSTQGADCKLTVASISSLTADCPRPATLVRLELDYPGWSAQVNGASVPISAASAPAPSIVQSISLPAGLSVIGFSYQPSHVIPAYALALLCLLVLIGLPLAPVVRRRLTGRGAR